MNKIYELIQKAYCKTRPNCKLKGLKCFNCGYGDLVMVPFIDALIALGVKVTLEKIEGDPVSYLLKRTEGFIYTENKEREGEQK